MSARPVSTEGPPADPPAPAVSRVSERKLLFLLGAVQFINVVDFMMVMPLGPDFAASLGIPIDRLGLVAGVYTVAAAVAGVVGALFLDRFDRRKALFGAMLGLILATAAGGLATGMTTMLAARLVAGAFGGPATALTLSIVADTVPPERRGKALGALMGAFSAASVLGVPVGLELARLGGWRTPFFALAGLGVLIASGVAALLPPLRGHLDRAAAGLGRARPLRVFLADPAVFLSLAAGAAAMTGAFAIIVNISAFVQYNLHYPRERLGLLYMAGGAVSFFSMRFAGRLVDRRGSVEVATFATAVVVAVIALVFVPNQPWLPATAMFIGFMMGNSTRMVALNALTSRVPLPAERARFMSAQSAIQHLSTATGAALSALFLSERPDHSLAGMPVVAIGAIVLTASLPLFLGAVSARVRARAAGAVPKTELSA